MVAVDHLAPTLAMRTVGELKVPEMTAVGNQINPPDPAKGVALMSSILGVRQQRQALQTGAIEQQTARAQAQEAGLKAQQQQGVQDFFQSFDPTGHIGDDGTIDLDSALQSKEFKASGNAKPAIMQALLDAKTKSLENKKALAGLNGSLVTQLGTQVGALGKDPDVVADKTDPTTGVNAGRAKLTAALDNFSKLSPDAARVAAIYRPMLDHTPPGKLSGSVRALQLQAEDASAQQAQQNPAQLAVNTGPATNVYNVDRSQGLQPGQAPAQTIQNDIGPQIVQYPNGTMGPAGGRYGTPGAPPGNPAGTPAPSQGQPPAAPQGAARPSPATNPFKGPNGAHVWTAQDTMPDRNAPKAVQEQYQVAVQGASQAVDAARTADKDYGVNMSLADNIRRLSSDTATGPGTAAWNSVMGGIGSRFGASNIADYQQLGAFLENQASRLQASMNLPSTNAGLAAGQAIGGHTGYQREAIQAKNDYLQSLVEGAHQYRSMMDRVEGFTGMPNPMAVKAAQAAWNANFDPRIYEGEMAYARSKEEGQKFMEKLTPKEKADLIVKRKNLQALSQGQIPQ